MFHILFASTTTLVFTFRLEATLKQATDDKKEMEAQISEYSLKIENLENGKRHFIIYSIL